jgi:hypothetical protein
MSLPVSDDATVPVPLFWRASTANSFLEIPIRHEAFHSIEIQRLVRFNQAGDRVEGHILELHLHSGALEIYAEPQLELDEDWFHSDPPFAHFELEALTTTEFDHVKLDIGSGSVEAAAAWTDRRGDRIEIAASLAGARPSKPLFTPAPVQRTPRNLRFLVMQEFRLLPTRSTDVSITVGGVAVEPEPFLAPVAAAAPFLSARAGTDFLLVGLNPAHHDVALPMVGQGQTALPAAERSGGEQGETTEVTVEGSKLTSCRVSNRHGWLDVRLDPGLPSPAAIADGDPAGQSGTLTIESPLGPVCTGRWSMWPVADGVAFELSQMTQDWSPGFGQPARMALRTVRRYRRRDQQWVYRAGLRRADGHWLSTGSWSTGAAAAATAEESSS